MTRRAGLRGAVAFALCVGLMWFVTVPPVNASPPPVGTHPQAVTDAAGLDRLRAARTGDHTFLADLLKQFLERYRSAGVGYTGIGAYAIGAEVFQDAAYLATAKTSLDQLTPCPTSTSAEDANDLARAQCIRNVAEAYDILFNDLSATERQHARQILADAAADVAARFAASQWWSTDYTNNHNWVNGSALGLAGYTLLGEDSRAQAWIDTATANARADERVGNAVTDGSWHEGVGYQDLMLASQIPFYRAAALHGVTLGDTTMLRGYGRHALYDTIPGHARQQVVTSGDWNWSRPLHAAVLSYTAARYQDQYAQTAALRWEQDVASDTARSSSADNSEYLALQYLAYDGSVPVVDVGTVAKDYYAADQQASILRTGFGSDDFALGFKSGVHGGRGLFNLYKAGQGPSTALNFGHDHDDDLSIFYSGRGGWYLPEAASYNCCTREDWGYTTAWHNSFLVDGVGQLGDDRNSTNQKVSSSAPWFFGREGSMPLHGGTDHYAFSRGDGTGLYPTGVQLSSLTRTVAMSRDTGYLVARDAARMGGAHTVDALFHSQVSMDTSTPGWLLATNEQDRLLGIRVVAPAGFSVDTGSQANSWSGAFYSHDADGRYAYARVHAPRAAQADFLSVLWPTDSAHWTTRPTVSPLDAGHPENGLVIPTPTGAESWVYGSGTSAGGLSLTGASIGLRKTAADGSTLRLVLVGSGSLAWGGRTQLSTTNGGPIEVAISGSSAAVSGDVSGRVSFYAPAVTSAIVNGKTTTFTRASDGTITLGAAPSVTLTAPTGGAVITGTASLTASASAPDGVAGVQFLADGRRIGAEDTTSPYAVPVDTTATLTSGVHLISARVRTRSGATKTSTAVRLRVSNPTATVSSSANVPWPGRIAVTATGQVTATATLSPGTADTVAGIGLGHGAATTWDRLAVTTTFSDDGTVAALDSDHYVSSGLAWTAGASYDVKLVVDVAAKTYSAYVRPHGAAAYTRIGETLHFRTSQTGVTNLDTATVPAGAGSVRVTGLTVTTPAHLASRRPLTIAVGQPTRATFQAVNDGGEPVSIDTLVVGNRDAAGANVDFPATAPFTLEPGGTYSYDASRLLRSGTYSAWPGAQVKGQWRELAAQHVPYTVP